MASPGIFQSKEWAELQTLSEHRGLLLPKERGQAFVLPIPFLKHYLYIPRGISFQAWDGVKNDLTKLAQTESLAWVRVEPETDEDLLALQQHFPGHVHISPHEMQPRENLVVDITPPEGDILSKMKPKTRYNVRLAEKNGVTVRFTRDEGAVESFLELIFSTTARKGIAPHPREYYRSFFQAFSPDQCIIAVAEHEGQVLAANLLVFFDGTVFYLHGGSSDEKRELMAPFLLHFASMKEAKRRGMTHYDFGGVRLRSKESERDADWDGITRFKTGFAPATETELFPGTYDIVFSPMKYQLYLVLRALSKQARVVKRWFN